MQFGLFGSAAARRHQRGGRRVRQQRGVSRLHRIQCRGRGARLSRHLRRRAPFHRLRPGLGDAQPADLARRAHPTAAARHRGDRAAVAQPGTAGRAGRDPRPAVRRPARFRHRQGLSLQRVRRVLRADGRGRRALRRMPRRDRQGVDLGRAVLASRALLAVRRHRRRAADRAEAAPADLDGRRQRALDPPRRRARLQSAARPICLAGRCRPRRSPRTGPRSRRAGAASTRCRSASPAPSSSATAQAEKEAALRAPAAEPGAPVEARDAARRHRAWRPGPRHRRSATRSTATARCTATPTRSPRSSTSCAGPGSATC